MAKIKESELRPFEIQPLNEDVLGNLSIEELEERLEMQLLHVSEAQWCPVDICVGECSLCNQCSTQCTVGYCATLCNQCTTQCGAECTTLCGADVCYTDGGGGGCLQDGPFQDM